MAIKFFAFFFSDNQYFRMFLVSMADIIGSYERLPNDAVRAVAVAKRREYFVEPPTTSSGSCWHWYHLEKSKLAVYAVY